MAFILAGFTADLLHAGDYAWNESAGGTFSDAANWTPTGGPPDADDYVTFDLGETYAIAFSENAASSSIFVRNDQTMFVLDGYEYAVTFNTVVGFYGGENGRLEVVGGLVTTNSVHVGYVSNAAGTLILSNHATLQVVDLLDIANTDDTNAHILVEESSSLSSASMVIGGDLNAIGSLQITGVDSTFDCSGEITVGNLARGVMLVEEGANATSASAVIGFGNDPGQIEKAIGNVVVSDMNSRWINAGSLTVGNTGTAEGSMAIANGGYVENLDATLGVDADARGMVIIDGTGATWKCNSLLTVGRNGSGTMTVSGSGAVFTAGTDIAALVGSQGTVLITGQGTTWSESSDMNVGGVSGTGGGNGSLSVASGGVLSVTGELKIHDDGSFTLDAGTVNVGAFVASGSAQIDFNDGTLIVDGGNFINSAASGTTIDGNSASALPALRLVDAANGTAGPLLSVGSDRRGAMEILGGSIMVANEGAIGVNTDSLGTVTVNDPGSQWQINGTLRVGDSGSGELNILGGASVLSAESLIGINSGADGKITVATSTM